MLYSAAENCPSKRIMSKKTIIWFIFPAKTSSSFAGYLAVLRAQLEPHLEIRFFAPQGVELSEEIKSLNPVVFPMFSQQIEQSEKSFLIKRSALATGFFEEGLSFADVLLVDDLAGGQLSKTLLKIQMPERLCGIVLPIPSPMGSSFLEEKLFNSVVLGAREVQVPCFGYELLPLDTRWTLAPSLVDGIIARSPMSCDFLRSRLGHNNIWRLPWYEGVLFSFAGNDFFLRGVTECPRLRGNAGVDPTCTVLYLPHNVAQFYDYKKLLEILQPFGEKLHLMFSVSEDQVRGGYTPREMIEEIYKEELCSFASRSYHSADSLWATFMADAVISCSANFKTEIAQGHIPAIIFDPYVPPASWGYTHRVHSPQELVAWIKELIRSHQQVAGISEILLRLAAETPAEECCG